MDMFQLAFLFESADFTEWIVLLAVTLIVMGPQRLPEMARKMGRWAETFRRAADEFKRQIMTMDEKADHQEPDYMDYTKHEPEDPYYSGEASSEPVTATGETTPEATGAPETVTPEYQDSYPSDGIPVAEKADSHKEPVAGVEPEGEKKP
jgi:Sec-independent protein translocase protein TatA